MYHYMESGLRNVWLRNGYNVEETPYGKTVSIQDVGGLHRVIAHALTLKAGRLTGAEFRFLRKEQGPLAERSGGLHWRRRAAAKSLGEQQNQGAQVG